MTVLLWTFPLLMLASVAVGWAAEVTAARFSAGIALAVLAWLQTAPEFAVEATIAWNRDSSLALANLTGSLRLLLGLGWPMVFFVHRFSAKRRNRPTAHEVVLPNSFAVEAAGLAIPVFYFLIIAAKGTWTAFDGAILCSFYFIYLWMINRGRKHEEQDKAHAEKHPEHQHDEDPWVVRKILSFSKLPQTAALLALFAFGAIALWVTVHPFVEALKATALALGVSEFVFIQWIAPIASEFPEKVTAFNWARRPGKVSMAIVNMLSSVTSQWTLLAGLIPILFSLSAGHLYTIEFSEFQKHELWLTIAQSATALVILADLKVTAVEMGLFFTLWVLQMVLPSMRLALLPAYGLWILVEIILVARAPGRAVAWTQIRKRLKS